MSISQKELDIAARVAEALHQHDNATAAMIVAEMAETPLKSADARNPKVADPFLQSYLHNLLEQDCFIQAAQILWSPTQFNPNPMGTREVWRLFEETDTGLIMGAAKMSKSFSMGVRLFLEWVRDPEYTTIRVAGPSENHLEENLFSHIVNLHQQATLKMPGDVGDLFIGLDRRNQISSIRGIVIPKGNVRKAGRLQGGHRRPRTSPHPLWGPLSRMFIFLDEIENIPMGIWQDVDNVLSEIEKGGQGFKIFGAYNPSNSTDEVAKRAEPPFGWGDFDPDTHYRWKSIRGWDVLRLDGERCENVIQGQCIYPGLQTREGLERIARNAGGRQAPGYLTMGRGCYPFVGVEATVIPPGMLLGWRREYIWYDDPKPVAAEDLALEGDDDAVWTLGRFGLATGMKYPPSLEFPQGRTVMFKDRTGNVTPRWALQADHQVVVPKGDTIAMKTWTITTNRRAGIRPEFFACDRTGSGAGVADLIRFEWSTLIHDVNYSEGASETKIMFEDQQTAKEQCDRVYSELWFALRAWGEFGYFSIHPSLDLSKLTQQLTQRRFKTQGKKIKVESKKDYKARGYSSPGEADSLTLLVHAARKGSGVIPSMRGEDVMSPGANEMDDWNSHAYPGGVRIDPSNLTDHLDTGVTIL